MSIIAIPTFTISPVAPGISSLDVSTGPEAGGTAVVITGTNFTGATGVTFGGVAGTSFSVVSPTTINVTTPAGTGTVDVVVQHPLGNATLAAGFGYTGGEQITATWQSAWDTATGSSQNAATDGNTWNYYDGDQASLTTVVVASGLGFPSGMTNVMRIAVNGDNYQDIRTDNQWAALSAGYYLYRRLYFTNSLNSNHEPSSHHPLTLATGTAAFYWNMRYGRRSGPYPRLGMMLGYDDEWELDGNDSMDAVYRQEDRWQYISNNSYRYQIRIYDSSNVLQWTNTDFEHWEVGGDPLGANPLISVPNAYLRDLQLGQNGPGFSDSGYLYFGGIAVYRVADSDAWIGPWGNCVGEST